MKFCLLVGVEGTGHHMVRAVLEDHLKLESWIDKGAWHPLLHANSWDAEKAYKNRLPRRFRKRKEVDVPAELRRIILDYTNQGVTNLFETTSFPSRQPRSTLRRPDLIEMFDALGTIVEFRILILHRDPVSVAYSGSRRFTDNYILQSKIVEDNFIYIERQCSQLPSETYRVLSYEKFLCAPETYFDSWVDWWDLDPLLFRRNLVNLKAPISKNDIPDPQNAFLRTYFSPRRTGQWQEFFSTNSL